MYIEKKLPKQWVAYLLIVFAILTIPNSWLHELNENEARFSIIAQEILSSGDFFVTQFQGAPTSTPPMISWFMAILWKVLPVNEFSVRLTGILSLGALALLCGYIALKSAGPEASAATVAATISSYIALNQGTLGEEDMMFALFINLAWFVWYLASREKRIWLYAWFFAHFFVFLALLTGGIKAIFFFYFPLLFLRRPLNIWRRLRQSDHITSLMIFILFLLIWIFMAPYQKDGVLTFIREFEHQEATSNYFLKLIAFPIKSFLYYLPWLFLAWPAYCMAFIPLEKDVILGQFLRTITISLFYCLWIVPDIKPIALTPLIGPLSIQLGLSYKLLVRRYGRQLLVLPQILSTIAIVGSVTCWLIFIILRRSVLMNTNNIMPLAIAFVVIAIAMAIYTLNTRSTSPISLSVLLSATACYLAFSSTSGVYAYANKSNKRLLGEHLSENMPPDVVVYEMISKTATFPGESFYINRPVIRAETTAVLPTDEDTVYVVGLDRIPITQDRTWSPASAPIGYLNYRLRTWKGEKRILDINPRRIEFLVDRNASNRDDLTKNIIISNPISKPLDIFIHRSVHGVAKVVGPQSLKLKPGELAELKVTIDTGSLSTPIFHDAIPIRISHNKREINRRIEITVRSGSDR